MASSRRPSRVRTQVYAYSPDPVEQARQLRWLEEDLRAANDNRDQVPWIIM
jgi:hypothetical protein